MSTFEEERERDLNAYKRLKDDILARHQGKYIAIAGGRLVLASESFDEAFNAVKDYRHALVFPAGTEPLTDLVYIRWLSA